MTPRGTWGGSGSSLGLTTKPVQGHQPSSVPAALPHPSQTKWVCAGWSCKVPGISIPDTKLKNPRQRFAWEERRKETKTLVATSFACQPICTATKSYQLQYNQFCQRQEGVNKKYYCWRTFLFTWSEDKLCDGQHVQLWQKKIKISIQFYPNFKKVQFLENLV